MNKMDRRPFLGAAMAGLPFALLGRCLNASPPPKIAPVWSGEDRMGENHTIGVSSTSFKVLTQDSGGGLFVMEHTNRKKGGPPLHLHHNEDEWFYPIEGQYIVQVGPERYQVKAGDSILAPRGTPHTWAFSGSTSGRMIIVFAPAGKMEAFFRDTERRRDNGGYVHDADIYGKYGMELLGPALTVE